MKEARFHCHTVMLERSDNELQSIESFCFRGSIQDKARRDTATTEQVSPGNLFSQPRRKKKRVPRKFNPIEDDSDEEGALGGAGLPLTYREFVKRVYRVV